MVTTKKMEHKAKNYGMEYFKRCQQKGIDYSFYGKWQQQYAKMVVFVSGIYKIEMANKVLLDVGSACGANLRAFKETGVFSKCVGIDISKVLVKIGNTVNKFEEDELIVDDCATLEKIPDESIDLIHCSQLFEHLSMVDIDKTIISFTRVLKHGGIGFITLNAIKKGQTAKDVTDQDPTHITVMDENQWGKRFNQFEIKKDINKILAKAKFYPGDDGKNFYEHYFDDWSVFVFSKP
jgi:ubiquinone/menaquinone biosynthesis C-methylase UbiE